MVTFLGFVCYFFLDTGQCNLPAPSPTHTHSDTVTYILHTLYTQSHTQSHTQLHTLHTLSHTHTLYAHTTHKINTHED